MPDATWRSHPLYEGYEVSDDGRVRSVDRWVPNRWGGSTWRSGHTLLTFPRRSGYLGGNISIDGVRLNFEVHRVVCEAFHGPCPQPDLEVRHLNGNKLDNRPLNLAWGTKSENGLDRVRHGTHNEANQTHCIAGHEFTDANTYRAPSAPRKRKCRACMVMHEANRKPRVYAKRR